MDVSIIIVNYRTVDLVKNAIVSIWKNTRDISYEIIVIDNNSGDDLSELFNLNISNLILLNSDNNLGFGKANNQASLIAKGRNLFFLNPDTYLLNNAIKYLCNYIDSHLDIGIVGGNLYNNNMEPNLSYEMLYPSILMDISGAIKNGLGFSISKFLYGNDYEYNHSGLPKEVAYITGAALMIRKKVFIEIEGFDSTFFMYCEDADLSYRIRKRKLKIVNVPLAQIVHLEGKSIKFNEIRKIRYYEGRRIFYKKHYTLFYYIIANIIECILLLMAIFINILRPIKAKRYKQQLKIFYKINFSSCK